MAGRIPIAWGRDYYADRGLARLHGMLADGGNYAGIGLTLHLSATQHFVIGVSWSKPHKMPAGALADLQLFAIYAWPAFNRTWTKLEVLSPAEALTDRECHCLYWVTRGMTDLEIAERVGLTRRTVERNIQSATEKLGASRRTEAAVLADRLGFTHKFRIEYTRGRVQRVNG